MVRPNGSVIGRDKEAAEVNEGSVIQQALSLPAAAIVSAGSGFRNAQSRHDGLGIQSAVRCSPGNQRLGVTGTEACAGSGKGDGAGVAAEGLDGFGFFGFNIFRALGGGPAG